MTEQATDPWSLSPEQATAELERMTVEYRNKQAADPRAPLVEKFNDPKWQSRLSAGSAEARAEFDQLVAAAAAADPVSAAMNGTLPDVPSSDLRQMATAATWLREIGVSEGVVEEVLSGAPTNKFTRDEALRWKERHMKDEGWVERLMKGDSDAVRELTLCSIILSQPIEEKAR